MSLRQQAKILGISPAHLSRMVNGVRPWNSELKERYEQLVGNTSGNTQVKSVTNEGVGGGDLWVRSTRIDGGAGENRTLYLFNAIEALSQMSYSPTQLQTTIIQVFVAK
jgi:hypothetical protein